MKRVHGPKNDLQKNPANKANKPKNKNLPKKVSAAAEKVAQKTNV